MTIEVNGEQFTSDYVVEVLRLFYNDAKQIAGVFHGMNRSAKFRAAWPDEYKFANSEWKSFIEATRQMYLNKISDPKVSPRSKHQMFLALAFEAQIAKDKETDNRLQVHPNSQQFVGDAYENKKIEEKFGNDPDPVAQVLSANTTRH